MLVWLYNLFFVLVLPLLLALWAGRTDEIFEAGPPLSPPVGAGVALVGGLLMGWSIVVFVAETGRAPSNAAPPDRRVSGGPYRLLTDPIYVGAALLAFGASAWLGSGGGFWLAAPALAWGAAALVFGREAQVRPPADRGSVRALLSLSEGAETRPDGRSRASCLIHIAALILSAFLLGAAPVAAPGWVWALEAITVGLAALAATGGSSWRLRRFLIGWWVAGAIYFAVAAGPAPLIPSAAGAFAGMALGALVGACFAATPRRALLGLAAAAPGMAAAALAPDRLHPGVGLALLAASLLPLHTLFLAVAERVANSWCALRIGPLRIINYAAYAFLGAAAAAAVFLMAVGDQGLAASLVIAASVVVSAGLWGQMVEFSGRLARPFGYYGALCGAFIGVGIAALVFEMSPSLLGAGLVLGAPVAQAIGRLRCLVQGCCHGRACPAPGGIVYRKPQSRVLRIARLGGRPVHPTPLYSIYANGFVLLVLVRLALGGAPQTLLIGVYLMMSGSLRFVEEAYRGEPQTPVWRGLKLYQWLAVGQAALGAPFTLMTSPPLPPLSEITLIGAGAILASGLIAGFAMGVDFPHANRRFAQLTPTDL